MPPSDGEDSCASIDSSLTIDALAPSDNHSESIPRAMPSTQWLSQPGNARVPSNGPGAGKQPPNPGAPHEYAPFYGSFPGAQFVPGAPMPPSMQNFPRNPGTPQPLLPPAPPAPAPYGVLPFPPYSGHAYPYAAPPFIGHPVFIGAPPPFVNFGAIPGPLPFNFSSGASMSSPPSSSFGPPPYPSVEKFIPVPPPHSAGIAADPYSDPNRSKGGEVYPANSKDQHNSASESQASQPQPATNAWKAPPAFQNGQHVGIDIVHSTPPRAGSGGWWSDGVAPKADSSFLGESNPGMFSTSSMGQNASSSESAVAPPKLLPGGAPPVVMPLDNRQTKIPVSLQPPQKTKRNLPMPVMPRKRPGSHGEGGPTEDQAQLLAANRQRDQRPDPLSHPGGNKLPEPPKPSVNNNAPAPGVFKRGRGRPRKIPLGPIERPPDTVGRFTALRTSNSCWTCKLRRKKCDARRPACVTCQNLGIECMGYDPTRPDYMIYAKKNKEMRARVARVVQENREAARRAASLKIEYKGVTRRLTPIINPGTISEGHERDIDKSNGTADDLTGNMTEDEATMDESEPSDNAKESDDDTSEANGVLRRVSDEKSIEIEAGFDHLKKNGTNLDNSIENHTAHSQIGESDRQPETSINSAADREIEVKNESAATVIPKETHEITKACDLSDKVNGTSIGGGDDVATG